MSVFRAAGFKGFFGDSRTRAGPFTNQTVNSTNAIITATNCTIVGGANEVSLACVDDPDCNYYYLHGGLTKELMDGNG